MSILRTTHFRGGDRAEMAAIAKEARQVWQGFGADLVSYRLFQAGPSIGETLFVVRLPDWASMGKALDRAATDPAYQALLKRVTAIAEVVSVDYLSDIEI